jgi:hypothetical protein
MIIIVILQPDPTVLKYNVGKQSKMPSSEPLTCEECNAIFSTIEALDEHRKAEPEDKKLRNVGFADG